MKVKSIGIKNFKSKDMDENSLLRNVFLTASSYLIEELKKSYSEHVKNVKF